MVDLSLSDVHGITLATSGKYCCDNIKITPDNSENIKAENIKKGVSILGIIGTLESGSSFEVNETVIASQCTNMFDSFNSIISETRDSKYTYICWLKNKKITEIDTNNQFMFAFSNSLLSGGWRYRNGGLSLGTITTNYDGIVNIGDVFGWTKVINQYV